MSTVLVDSNVILDVFTEDPTWYPWSAEALSRCSDESVLAVNPIIYAEVSVRFATIEELEDALPAQFFRRLHLPWEAAFLAAKCFYRYKASGGTKTSTLPDFYIGAHAAVSDMSLLTRDPQRFSRYFPRLRIIAPQSREAGCRPPRR